MDKLSMAIVAMEAHVACTNERLRQAWDVIHAKLVDDQTMPNTGCQKCQYSMLGCANEGNDDKCGNCHVSNFVALR